MPALPYRIVTERLVVRCWTPDDAAAAKEAIDASLDHLRPWMPWAEAEPTTLERKVELLRGFQEQFHAGDDGIYAIFDRAEERVLGGTGLHPRIGEDAREIGYWIRADATGRGLATESSAALTRIGFELLDLERVEIHVAPRNTRSAAVPRKLGYEQAGAPDGQGHMVFRIGRGAYRTSACAAAVLEAYDEAGTRVL
jgi:RimJ/RimL family protein N-acetyltransferase